MPSIQIARKECSRVGLYVSATHRVDALTLGSTVGAGDTFIAGMLFGLTCQVDWSLERKLEFANELAGRKVAQEGLHGLASLMEHAFST